MKRSTTENADRVLFGLGASATAADLKRAYRRAALELHPDQNPDPGAAARFRELADAYDRLAGTLAPTPPKKRSLQDRAAWFVADARALLKRWPAERWQAPVDGLPAAVWLFSALEVLARLWTPPGPVPAAASPADLAACLDAWSDWLAEHPLPKPGRTAGQTLGEALGAAEARLKALTRPRRSRSPL